MTGSEQPGAHGGPGPPDPATVPPIQDIDAWLGQLSGSQSLHPAEFAALVDALPLIDNEFTLADALHVITRVAPPDSTSAVDALVEVFRANRTDAFLGPEALRALSILAERSALAAAELRGQVLRLTREDTRYLLVCAAKVIARHEFFEPGSGLGSRLSEWVAYPDPAVQAEARYQSAVLALWDALREEDLLRFRRALRECRVGFARAAASEELRFDAELFVELLDVVLTYLESTGSETSDVSQQVEESAMRLAGRLDDPELRIWHGLASSAEALLEHRIYRIAVGFSRIVNSVREAEAWTNLDESLVELAAVFSLMWSQGQDEGGAGITASLALLGPRAVLPRLGPLLQRAVRRTQFEKVIAKYEAMHGTDSISAELQRLHEAACAHEYTAEASPLSEPDGVLLLRIALASPEAVPTLCRSIPGAEAALRAAGVDVSRDSELPGLVLPIDNPGLYGADPNVDEAVRAVLEALRLRVGPVYPNWNRCVDVIVSVAQILNGIRNDLPGFVRCAEAGGLGQSANEGHLQDYVFERLRGNYGRGSVYESTRVAGGRSDNGVVSGNFFMPIECKAEYSDVSRDHIRTEYLQQADIYAGERDRVAILLVLDARDQNAAGHRERRRTARRRKEVGAQPVARYGLKDGCWVDGLPVDSQVEGARPNAVVVALVPGNQPGPSHTSEYSRSPKRA